MIDRQKELTHFYKVVRKVIRSKPLSNREGCDMATMFMIFSLDRVYKKCNGDYLYSKLLDENIKQGKLSEARVKNK